MQYTIPEWLKKIYREAFGSNFEEVLMALTKPPKKYFLRVNTFKTDTKSLIKKLNEEGIEAKQDDIIEEAVYIEGYKENELNDYNKYVIAKLDAAESVATGADLYRAGVLSIKGANKNDLVNVVTNDFTIASEGVLIIEPKDLAKIQRGIVVKKYKTKIQYTIHKIFESFYRRTNLSPNISIYSNCKRIGT